MRKPCNVISISNQKGGVGKTTTAINLGVALSEMGKRVLLVDFDPQANLTMGLGYPKPDELDKNIAKVLLAEIEGRASIAGDGIAGDGNDDYASNVDDAASRYIIKTSHGVDFIPSSIELAGIENTLMNTISRESVLDGFLSRHKQNYEYILVDCLPSLNILTINALTASDEIIIPVQAQYFSAKGLELLLKSITSVQRNLNRRVKIAGILITMMDKRSSFQKEVYRIVSGNDISLNEANSNKRGSRKSAIRTFDTIIPLSVKVSSNQSKGITMLNERNNSVTEGYIAFAHELVGDCDVGRS